MSIVTYIEDLKRLPEPRKTFMEIMKVHKSEVQMANILAYFFKSEEKHGLGKVFIAALLETNSYSFKTTHEFKGNIEAKNNKKVIENALNLTLEIPPKLFEKPELSKDVDAFVNGLSRVYVKTEGLTGHTNQKKKRIDLILETDKCVICIEFKINHVLNNPLNTYQKQIISIEKGSQNKGEKPRDLFFIVLTPNKKTPEVNVQDFIDEPQDSESQEFKSKNLFRQVILSHFINNVIKKIPKAYFLKQSSNPEVQYLTDLIQTIQNREVRFKRREILKDLFTHINYKYDSEYFLKGGYGGYIQIKSCNSIYKIRLANNNQIQIECWSKKNSCKTTLLSLPLSCLNNYETIIQTLSQVIKKKVD